MKGPRFAYRVLIGCCMMNCGVSGLINAAGLFYSPMAADLGLTIAQISSVRTVQSLSCAFFLFFFAHRLLKSHYRETLIAACLIHSLAYLSFCFCGALWQFYAVSVFSGFSLSVLQTLAVSTVLNACFTEKRGTAFSVAASASGISGIVISGATGNLLAQFGWQAGYAAFGIFSLVMTLSAALLFILPPLRKHEIQLFSGAEDPDGIHQGQEKAARKGSRLMKNPVFYCLLFISAVFHFCTTATVHTANYASSIGFGIEYTAYISAVGLAGNTIGKISLGLLRDRVGTNTAAICEVLLVMLGFGALVYGKNGLWLMAGVFLVGSAMALPTVIAPVLTGDWFTGEDYSLALTGISTCGSLVGAVGNLIFGISFDLTQGYETIFSVCGLLMGVTCVMLMYLKRQKEGKRYA